MLIATVCLIASLVASPSQDIVTLEQLYQEGRFFEARSLLSKITPTKANAPDLLLYMGLLEANAEKSIAYFEKLIAEYPKSPNRFRARFTIAQHQFLKESYEAAISSLQHIIKAKEDSGFHALSCFWTARCYEALHDTSRAISWYEKVDEQSDSLSFSLAMDALKILKRAKSIFSIQIGSFKSKESARELAESFAEKGYETWLATTQKDGEKYYKVLIGEFDSREMAEGFLELFSEKETITYWIVKVRKL
jgi:tetratricopeptide (TPR) repeat protein